MLLTDFSSERWNGINMDDVKECLIDVQKRVEDSGRLLGELEHPYTFEVSLNKVSHSIKNIELVEDKIYGEVEILNTPQGKSAKLVGDLMEGKYRMGLRGSGRTEKKIKNTSEQIFSEMDPYGEENWNDEVETVQEIRMYKIYTWDLLQID